MLSFSEFDVLEESKKEKKHTGHFYDLDNCLVDTDHPNLRVHVLNSSGQKIRTLTNAEYNDHVLPKDHKYDFSEFASSELFGQTAKPIKRMIQHLRNSQKNKEHVAIVTSRGTMDNNERFNHHMNKFGIKIDNVNVHKVGDMTGKTSDLKAKVIQNEIHKHGFEKVHMYDDDHRNIDKFLKLQKQNPNVELHAHHVFHNINTGKTEIKHYKGQ